MDKTISRWIKTIIGNLIAKQCDMWHRVPGRLWFIVKGKAITLGTTEPYSSFSRGAVRFVIRAPPRRAGKHLWLVDQSSVRVQCKSRTGGLRGNWCKMALSHGTKKKVCYYYDGKYLTSAHESLKRLTRPWRRVDVCEISHVYPLKCVLYEKASRANVSIHNWFA